MTRAENERRRFIKRLAALGLGGAAIPTGIQLASMAAASSLVARRANASAPASAPDYKALVCVYLDGGCDHLTAVVPYDATNYQRLMNVRGSALVPSRDQLLPLTGATQGGLSVALSPSLPRLQSLFNTSKKLAIVTGVGSMVEPLTKADLRRGAAFPPGAGSHNDGNSMFHTLGIEGTQYGWGGKTLDLLESANNGSKYTSISAGRYNAFGSGLLTQQTQTDEFASAENLRFIGDDSMFGSTAGPAALNSVLRQKTDNLLEDAVLGTAQRVLDGSDALAAAFAASSVPDPFVHDGADVGRYYGDNSLGKQLRTVARAIQQRGLLGSPRRQVFFCSMDGYDTHGGTPSEQLKYVDRALAWFYEEMARQGLSESVTLFTTSEFGRTLKSNGDGTDHGWGGTAFVLGGAVRGGKVIGDLVEADAKSDDWIGDNRGDDKNVFQIPKISTEQYGATLARWFGVTGGDLDSVFPNLTRFSSSRLPFLPAVPDMVVCDAYRA